MTTSETRSELSIPQNTKEMTLMKTQSNTWKTNKHCINYGMINRNVETWKKKKK
jgi:hypothetical protein